MDQKTSTDRLVIARDGPVMRITLNRPDKLNALDGDIVEELIAALEEARARSVRLVAFNSTGKGFSGGFDFSGLSQQSDGDLALRFLRIEHLLQSVHYSPFVTVALVHGACFGAAADLVSSCTYRIAASGTRFRMPGLKFGIALGTRRLAELVGRDPALKVLMTSKVFEGEYALKIGFLTAISEPDEWGSIIAGLNETAGSLPKESFKRLLRITRLDHRDADLAELARSVAEPGLKKRVEDYLAVVAGAKQVVSNQ